MSGMKRRIRAALFEYGRQNWLGVAVMSSYLINSRRRPQLLRIYCSLLISEMPLTIGRDAGLSKTRMPLAGEVIERAFDHARVRKLETISNVWSSLKLSTTTMSYAHCKRSGVRPRFGASF